MEGFNTFRETVISRMHEMAAVAEAMGKKAEGLQAEARDEMHKAVKEIHAQQMVFQDFAERVRHYESGAWEKGVEEVEKAWADFEKLAAYAAGKFDGEREAIAARSGAQFKHWLEVVDQYSHKVAKLADDERERFDHLIDDLRDKQKDAEDWVREINAANANTWQAMSKGFEGAWEAFEGAVTTAKDEFEKTFGSGQGDSKDKDS